MTNGFIFADEDLQVETFCYSTVPLDFVMIGTSNPYHFIVIYVLELKCEYCLVNIVFYIKNRTFIIFLLFYNFYVYYTLLVFLTKSSSTFISYKYVIYCTYLLDHGSSFDFLSI